MKGLNLLERIPTSRWTQSVISRPLFEATPSKTIYSEGSLRVKIYEAHEAPAIGQVIVFPSLINRPYVLDLGRGRSLIGALVRAGLEVILMDWGSPEDSERDLGLEGLLSGRLKRALDTVHAHSEFEKDDARPRTLLGHCLGGNLALLFAAQENLRSDPLKIDGLILLTTPIDTANTALLNTWFQTPEWDAERFAQSFQTIPWPLLQLTFQMLRPTMTPKRWWMFATRLTEKDFRESWLQMELWSNDNISFSSELFRDLLIPLYRENAMMNAAAKGPGKEALKPLWRNPSKLTLPIFSLAAIDDHIVPIESTRALKEALPLALHEFYEQKGGHIGALLSKRTRESLWKDMIRFASTGGAKNQTSASAQAAPAKNSYRTDPELRANQSQKSAATSVEA